MTYPYGFCECSSGRPEAVETISDMIGTLMLGTKSTSHCCIGTGPAAFTAVRDNKKIKLCTKCILSRDSSSVKLLVQPEDDLSPFTEFDELGAFIIVGRLQERIKS